MSPLTDTPVPLDVAAIREDFPGLHQQVHGHPLVYLDNAATAQICQPSLDAIVHFHTRDRANVHRGVHELSQRATASYDGARGVFARFLNASRPEECVYVRGTTEGINLFAHSWGLSHLSAGDEIVLTAMEHHANLVPWQLVAQRTGAVIRSIPIDDRGMLRMDVAEQVIGPRTKLLAFVHTSNALGTVNPAAELIRLAKAQGATVLVDGAQAAPHGPVDVQALGADAFVFSGHKTVGPTGAGVLWVRHDLLETLPPYQGGGDMIETVTVERSTYQPAPLRFEAGTQAIAEVIGLAAALEYLMGLGMDRVAAREAALYRRAVEATADIEGFRMIGTAPEKAAVLSFVVDGTHPTDLGMLLDTQGVAVRTGHHCAQPVMDHFDLSATARASFAFYNTEDEVDRFAAALRKVIGFF